MWAMYKSSRELIKMQDLQKLGKLAAACSHLWSSGSLVRQGQHPRQAKQASPPLAGRQDPSPLCLDWPSWLGGRGHPSEGPRDLLVGLLGQPPL